GATGCGSSGFAAGPSAGTTITSCMAAPSSTATARLTSGDVDDHVLELGVQVQRVGPELPPPTALLVAAPGRDRVDDVVAVHVNGSSAKRVRDAVSARDVAGPHPGDQPVDRAVRLGDQVLLVAERDRGHDRAEDLLARDAHLAV